MFTGIIEELGEVTEVRHLNDSAVLSVRGRLVTSDATAGSSIAVNGTCLTVTALDGDTFAVDVMAESLSRTSLGRLTPGDGNGSVILGSPHAAEDAHVPPYRLSRQQHRGRAAGPRADGRALR